VQGSSVKDDHTDGKGMGATKVDTEGRGGLFMLKLNQGHSQNFVLGWYKLLLIYQQLDVIGCN